MRSVSELASTLKQIDGRQYPSYKDLLGAWDFGQFVLYVDHVQGDAFAAPSRMRVQVPHSVSQIPAELWAGRVREVAVRDFFARRFGEAVAKAGGDMRQEGGGWHAAKGGDMVVDMPQQTVLERTAVVISSSHVEARFTLALPAQGRTVMGRLAHASLVGALPRYVAGALLYSAIDPQALLRHVQSVEDSAYLRAQLPALGLVAFVADNSILPRKSGASDLPMDFAGEVVAFASPASLARTLSLPNRGPVRGMGVPQGVTLITGGGFHGKSTLLQALQRGVYDHIPGDGRELVVTDANAVKIRAEDGRSVLCVDISPFIGQLPYGRRTDQFSSADASGSTSQAANIQEALEAGATALLLDEDTCATNFMIRDQRMQMLVARDPIKPLIGHVRALALKGVSSVLVVGGCGQFFDVADRVVLMDSFRAEDVTHRAKLISQQCAAAEALSPLPPPGQPSPAPPHPAPPASASASASAAFPPVVPRYLLRALSPEALGGKGYVRRSLLQLGEEELDLACVEQIVDPSQSRAILDTLRLIQTFTAGSEVSVGEILTRLEGRFASGGLDCLSDRLMGNYAMPRKYEIAAALNRLRCAAFQQK